MKIEDPARESLRVAEHYRQMSDAEILILVRQRSELTDLAQQALDMEMSHRGLKLGQDEPPAPPVAEPAPDSEPPDSENKDSDYKAERELVELCTVWSLRDALQLQSILDRAGIPFYMGPEKATGVDPVTSNFANGMSVRIMRVGMPWAAPVMRNYEPKDEPQNARIEEGDDVPVRCPRCHSEEVIFEQLATATDGSADSPPRFEWTCDSCAYHWEDDGIAKED